MISVARNVTIDANEILSMYKIKRLITLRLLKNKMGISLLELLSVLFDDEA